MDRARPGDELPVGAPNQLNQLNQLVQLAQTVQPDPLADETRHTALLLGGALGLMGLLAVVLLLVTTRFGG